MYKLTEEEIAFAKKRRDAKKLKLIEEYNKPLICLTLNIPGQIRMFELEKETFKEGCRRIEEVLVKNNQLVFKEFSPHATGPEAYFIADGDCIEIKKKMIALENLEDIGILFDIDVYDEKGNKVTREELNYLPRKCILCDRSYKECMYKSTHNVEDIVIAIHEIMDKFFND